MEQRERQPPVDGASLDDGVRLGMAPFESDDDDDADDAGPEDDSDADDDDCCCCCTAAVAVAGWPQSGNDGGGQGDGSHFDELADAVVADNATVLVVVLGTQLGQHLMSRTTLFALAAAAAVGQSGAGVADCRCPSLGPK